MSNIIKYDEDLISYIRNVILKYCPYIDNRLSILGNAMAPQLDIEININDNDSQIMFLFGNANFKSSIPERSTACYTISFEEIGDIIDFILEDHEVIKSVNFFSNKISLGFAINWTDKSIKGINCGDIDLNLNFENMKLKKQYLYLLFQRYYTHLEQVSSFKEIKDKYINNMKHSYFDAIDKTGLISLLSGMSENELKELLYNLDNDTFIKYAMDDKKQPKVRILSLEENNNNN